MTFLRTYIQSHEGIMVKNEDRKHFDGEMKREFRREDEISWPITIGHSSRTVIKHKNSTFCFKK